MNFIVTNTKQSNSRTLVTTAISAADAITQAQQGHGTTLPGSSNFDNWSVAPSSAAQEAEFTKASATLAPIPIATPVDSAVKG